MEEMTKMTIMSENVKNLIGRKQVYAEMSQYLDNALADINSQLTEIGNDTLDMRSRHACDRGAGAGTEICKMIEEVQKIISDDLVGGGSRVRRKTKKRKSKKRKSRNNTRRRNQYSGK